MEKYLTVSISDRLKIKGPSFSFFKNQFFFKSIFNLIYLFLSALGLRCCTQAFSSCCERGLLFIAVRRLLIAVASLVVEQGSRRAGFSSCGTRDQ